MTKNQNEFEPMLKSYQIFILSLLITTLLFLNSNHAHKIRYETKLNQEKGQLFDNIISKRYLDGESSPGSGVENSESSSKIDEVCERGSEELRSYYKTGNLNDIQLEEGNIKCEDKDKDYMKALINIIKSQYGGKKRIRNLEEEDKKDNGDLTDNIITYAKHILPVLIFIVVGILCIPGWIICCFCCCCNCCCCCCCKKPRCKIPCFIITYVMYALVVAVCFYGLSQSNKIFVGFANTECSILKFFDEVLEGESKDSLPKWAGINGIKTILNGLKTQLTTMGQNTGSTLQTTFDNTKPHKIDFLDKIKAYSELLNTDISTSSNLENYRETFTGNNAQGLFIYDLIKQFGRFSVDANYHESAEPEKSYAYMWLTEYKTVCDLVEEKMQNAINGFNNILGTHLNDITEYLDEGLSAIDSIDSSFKDIKGGINDLIVDYSGTIDDYGKLGVKIVFGVLALIDLAIAAFIFLLCFCSGKSCVNCCCCRCIFKLFTHLLWNILALLMIIVFLVGSIFALVGKVGDDAMSLVSFLVSEDNIGEGKETLLLEDSKKYVMTCFNGDGNVEKDLGFDTQDLTSLDNIKIAQDNLTYAKSEFDSHKEDLVTFNLLKGEIDDRAELNTEKYSLIKISSGTNDRPESLYLKILLDQLNNHAESKSKPKWKISCSQDNVCTDMTCIHPYKCQPKDTWISGEGDNYFEISNIIDKMKTIAGKAKTEDFYTKLVEVKNYYETFLDKYSDTFVAFNDTIKGITKDLNSYTGDGGMFSFINCKFFGTNTKIILKYLKESLGGDFYTVGVCLILVGCSLALAISSTILIIIIINVDIDKKKQEEKNKGNPNYPLNSEGRVIRYN